MDGIKNFIVKYDILADVEKALGPLKAFEETVNNLYNNSNKLAEKKGFARINEELNGTIGRIATIREEFNKIQPSFNLNPLRNNLRAMERMVSETAVNIQRTLSAALSGANGKLPTNSASHLSQDKRLIDAYSQEIDRIEQLIKEKTKKRKSMLPPDGQFRGRTQESILSIYGDPRNTEEFQRLDRDIKHQEKYLEELQGRRAEARKRYNIEAQRIGMPTLPNDLMGPKEWRNLKASGSKMGITEQKRLIEQYTSEVGRASEAVNAARKKLQNEFGRFMVDGAVDREAALRDPVIGKLSRALTAAETDYKKWQSKLENVSGKITKEAISKQQKIRNDYAKQLRAWRTGTPVDVVETIGPETPIAIPKELEEQAKRVDELKKTYKNAKQAASAKRKELLGRLKAPTPYTRPEFLGLTDASGKGVASYFKEYQNSMREYTKFSEKGEFEAAERHLEAAGRSRQAIETITGFKGRQFDKMIGQYNGYEQYQNELSEYQRKRENIKRGLANTSVYKDLATARQQLRDAFSAWRQVEELKTKMATTASAPAVGVTAKAAGGGLPSILGVNPQVLEQVFSGKLTLIPDIAGAKTLIAAETFNANLRLTPLLEEAQTKLNSKVFTVDVVPKIGAADTSKKNGKKGKAKMSVADSIIKEIGSLNTIAEKNPIVYRATFANAVGIGKQLRETIKGLQEIARNNPIMLSTPKNLGKENAVDVTGNVKLKLPKTTKIDVIARVSSLTNSVKNAFKNANGINKSYYVNVIAKAGTLTASIRRALAGKTFSINAKVNTGGKGSAKNLGVNVNAPGLAAKIDLLDRLNTTWRNLPRKGERTYTVNLKTTGLENIGRLEQLLRLVSNMPKSVSKNYNVTSRVGDEAQRRAGGYVGPGSSRRSPIYTKKASDDFYSSARRWAYPFTGNASFGARTPAALDMMKGMGVMMGVGGAMGVIGGGFSEAVDYQNTMETAKAILSNNYKGSNFSKEYNEMVRVVRDVAMRTKFTAPEAANATRFMAMAGLDIPMIKSAIEPIADVAAIADTDLGMVADKMTNIMTEFKVKPKDMRGLANMMTKTFTSTNTDMMMLAESLQYAGPMAFASGQSLAETLAMIGIMGNSGIQASMAGTTMRMMLQNIYNPNKKQTKFMESIGLKTRNADGSRRSLFEIMKDVAAITGKDDSKGVVAQLLGGKDEKNNIDTFEAASKLFRVTASAGGASILSNIGGVDGLINAIRSSEGGDISSIISVAKQNTVAGKWAQAKSAFTEAVVKVFENDDVQSLIKNKLGGIIEYLKSPEFVDNIKKIFDLVVNIANVLGDVAKAWMWVYDTFGGVVNKVIKWQFILTNIGYAMAPFIGFMGAASSLLAPFKGIGGVGAAASGAALAGRGISSALLANGMAISAINMAATGVAPHTPRTMAMDAIINGGYLSLSAKKRAHAIRAGRYAGMMERLEANNGSMSAYYRAKRGYEYESAMIATIASAQAQYAFERRKLTRPQMLKNTDFLYRAARQNRLSWGNLGAGMSAAFNVGRTGLSFSSLFASIRGGLTSAALSVAKAFGAIASPVGLATIAIGAFATTAYFYSEKLKKQAEEFRIRNAKNEKISGATAASIGHRQTEQIDEIRKNMGLVSLTGKLTPVKSPLKIGQYKVDPMLKNNAGISSYFGQNAGNRSDFAKKGLQLIEDMSTAVYGRRFDERDVRKKYWGVTNTDYFRNDVALAAVALAGANSQYAQKAAKPIQERLKAWSTIQDKEKSNQEWDKIVTDAKAVAERYNPSGKNLTDLRGKSYSYIENLRTSSAANTLQYQQGIYQSLLEINDPNNPIYGSFAAIHELRNMAETGTMRYYELLGRIAGNIGFTLPDSTGIERALNLQFDNGVITYEQFSARLASLGIEVPNKVVTFYTMLGNIYKGMSGVLAAAGGAVPSAGEYALGAGGAVTNEQIANMSNEEYGGHKDILKDWAISNPNIKHNVEEKYGSIDKWLGRKTRVGAIDMNKATKWYMNKNFGQSNVSAPTNNNNNNNENNKPIVPKPIARVENPNKGYESQYSGGASRPTQVIVNIDKLMNTDKMMVASSADERDMISMVEDRIMQGLDGLKAQIVMSLQNADYGIS